MVTQEDLAKMRASIAEVKRANQEIEAATSRNAVEFMRIDFDAAKKDRACGLVSDEEWDKFLEYYSLMRSHYRIFTEGKQAEENREFEQLLEKKLEGMEREYRAQNSISSRVKRFLGKKG